jgi:TPR repeat protein
VYLYLEKKYLSAKKYLEKAVKYDDPLAYRFLGAYFGEGVACKIDKKKALEYLEKGVSLGCAESICDLGIAYHKGVIVERDDKKAEKLLREASELDSMEANLYYNMKFKDFVGKMRETFENLKNNHKKAIEDAKPKPIRAGEKIGRNEKCPCESGKKYKKCCGNKSNKSIQVATPVPFK